MNVLIVNDVLWDNFALVSKRLNPLCINPNHRLNCFYGKHLRYISSICNQNSMCLIRRALIKDKLEECIVDSLKFSKFRSQAWLESLAAHWVGTPIQKKSLLRENLGQ